MPTIIPTDATQARDIARRLLDAADSPDDVATDTSGRTTAFTVSDELAEKAGFSVSDSDVTADADTTETDDQTGLEFPDGADADTSAADSPDDVAVEEPPRGGRGSGGQVWLDFLNERGVAIPENLGADDRDDLVAVWDTHLDTQG